LNVVLAATLVLSLSQFSILHNNVFALSGPPGFIVKLLFLSTLTFHKFK
jgi:hypothetical protein